MFVDQHRDQYGVEPICRVLPIAQSTYRAHAAKTADPTKRSEREKRDDELRSLQRTQGLASVEPGRDRGRPLHRRTSYDRHGTGGCVAREVCENNDLQPNCDMPSGQDEPPVPCAGTKSAMALGLHLCRDLGREILRDLLDRRLRQKDYRLARFALDGNAIRSGCPGAGAARPSSDR